ncbi:hypothetical protein EK904_011692, partial [Melospiza melodia maxima]
MAKGARQGAKTHLLILFCPGRQQKRGVVQSSDLQAPAPGASILSATLLARSSRTGCQPHDLTACRTDPDLICFATGSGVSMASWAAFPLFLLTSGCSSFALGFIFRGASYLCGKHRAHFQRRRFRGVSPGLRAGRGLLPRRCRSAAGPFGGCGGPAAVSAAVTRAAAGTDGGGGSPAHPTSVGDNGGGKGRCCSPLPAQSGAARSMSVVASLPTRTGLARGSSFLSFVFTLETIVKQPSPAVSHQPGHNLQPVQDFKLPALGVFCNKSVGLLQGPHVGDRNAEGDIIT